MELKEIVRVKLSITDKLDSILHHKVMYENRKNELTELIGSKFAKKYIKYAETNMQSGFDDDDLEEILEIIRENN
jgi:hypothetical protein